jgi:hypothetical protein
MFVCSISMAGLTCHEDDLLFGRGFYNRFPIGLRGSGQGKQEGSGKKEQDRFHDGGDCIRVETGLSVDLRTVLPEDATWDRIEGRGARIDEKQRLPNCFLLPLCELSRYIEQILFLTLEDLH